MSTNHIRMGPPTCFHGAGQRGGKKWKAGTSKPNGPAVFNPNLPSLLFALRPLLYASNSPPHILFRAKTPQQPATTETTSNPPSIPPPSARRNPPPIDKGQQLAPRLIQSEVESTPLQITSNKQIATPNEQGKGDREEHTKTSGAEKRPVASGGAVSLTATTRRQSLLSRAFFPLLRCGLRPFIALLSLGADLSNSHPGVQSAVAIQ